MRKGNLTRAQAIERVGASAVDTVDAENCDFTNRVQTDGDTGVEFSASVIATDLDGEECSLMAYYYQAEEDLDGVEDLGSLDWEIEGYEIV